MPSDQFREGLLSPLCGVAPDEFQVGCARCPYCHRPTPESDTRFCGRFPRRMNGGFPSIIGFLAGPTRRSPPNTVSSLVPGQGTTTR